MTQFKEDCSEFNHGLQYNMRKVYFIFTISADDEENNVNQIVTNILQGINPNISKILKLFEIVTEINYVDEWNKDKLLNQIRSRMK